MIAATRVIGATSEVLPIRIVRGVADLDPKMPRFIVAYLSAMWT